ncbi:hypothetical protein [Paenibacillus wynnii]|uniref:hypothetical protein n=1 Tax=Paenibacillus wynnii TaxID=268407 RepID=UPI002790307F|nr:hypothetical protein [Paenibacillus wynnii]MDQ0193466.1 hypothetical protein [Paenibacillus wynnii]
MMIGNILLNVLFGLIGFVLTFLVTLGNNLLMTSLIRGFFGFILWFMLAFVLRWVLGFIFKESLDPNDSQSSLEENSEALGSTLDISTPDEDEELKNLLKPQPGQGSGSELGFKPLQPPKLVSLKDPEELAKAVRHLKEE